MSYFRIDSNSDDSKIDFLFLWEVPLCIVNI